MRKSQIKKKKITLLIDGKNLMYVSFTGSNVEDNHRKNLNVNGIYTFLIKLRNIFIYFNDHPDYEINDVLCFWDGLNSGKLRTDIYPEYKISRKKQKENFTEAEQKDYDSFLYQIDRIKEYLPYLYIKSYTDEIVETDDMVSYYVQNKNENEHIVIATSDLDLFQLINKNVYVYNLRKRKALTDNFARHHLLTPINFKKVYGYPYFNIPTYKAVCGDSSDDIKGVGGIQLKGLLNSFPKFKDEKYSIDRILKETKEACLLREEKNKKPLQKHNNILENQSTIHLNKKLVDLSSPLITESCISNLETLFKSKMEIKDSKDLIKILIKDGITKEIKIDINYASLNDFFMPFKRYIDFKTDKKKIIRKSKNL